MSERRYRLVNLYPHISTVVVLTALGLRAVWKAPDWGHKLLELAVAIRSFRGHPPYGEIDDPGGSLEVLSHGLPSLETTEDEV
jgi:hypothetical protein